VAISDTSPAAQSLQLQILSAVSGEQRMTLAYEMSMFVRELMREGIRRDHPDWTEAQITRELLRRAFFPEPLPAWLPWPG
jgi:Rv0078B-related antitoxin